MRPRPVSNYKQTKPGGLGSSEYEPSLNAGSQVEPSLSNAQRRHIPGYRAAPKKAKKIAF